MALCMETVTVLTERPAETRRSIHYHVERKRAGGSRGNGSDLPSEYAVFRVILPASTGAARHVRSMFRHATGNRDTRRDGLAPVGIGDGDGHPVPPDGDPECFP